MSQQVNLPAMRETQEMWVQSLSQEDALGKEITTHSSILAWRIPFVLKTKKGKEARRGMVFPAKVGIPVKLNGYLAGVMQNGC